MTRVLYWNINNFSKNKILDDVGADPAYQLSQDRLAHIINRVVRPNPPDIFIIEECYARVREVGYPGDVLNTDGSVCFAILLLLDELRKLSPYWCLVPPLKVGNEGYREGVAVYYNAQNLQFTGPGVYSLQGGLRMARRPLEIPTAALSEYPDGLNEALPGVKNPVPLLYNIQRTWPARFADGPVQLPERGWAAQFEQRQPNGKVIRFPGQNNRTPYLTRFRDLAGKRTLKIFSIHTSPDTATDGTNRIPYIDEVITVRDDEVSLIVGDFNVDSFDVNAHGAYSEFLDLQHKYTWLFDPRDGAQLWAARKAYLMTHMLPATVTDSGTKVITQTAFPYNDVGVAPDVHHNVYPRFGYMGSWIANSYSDSGAIDNAFVRYGAQAAQPPSHNQTIVNTVVGKPYTAQPAPAHVTAELTGGLPYPQSLATAVPAGGLPGAGGDTINFSGWNNFGRIRSTSDHLALIMDV
jgi:hypothetical protein